MSAERLAVGFLDRARIHEAPGNNSATQPISEPVRHRVIDRHSAIVARARWHGFEVSHSTGKSGSDYQPARVRMILHVILRGMSENERGLHFSQYGGAFIKQPLT